MKTLNIKIKEEGLNSDMDLSCLYEGYISIDVIINKEQAIQIINHLKQQFDL